MSPLSDHGEVRVSSGGIDNVVDFHPHKMTTSLQQTLEELSLEDEVTTANSETDESSQAGNHFIHLKDVKRPTLTRASSQSILKPTESSMEFVCTKKSSYKTLPPPDLKRLSEVRSSSMPNPTRASRRKNSVSFEEIKIRMYDQTIGDHPNTSYGPPIALDWNFEECKPITVDDYEENRGARRGMRQMMMNYYTRKNILMWAYGFSEEDIKKASRATGKAQFQRGVTKYFLPVSKIEEVVESAGRKAKRVVGRRSSVV